MPFCCVAKCKAREKMKGSKLSLFTIPRDPELSEAWRRKIYRKDRPFKRHDRVCEKHFLPEEIIRNFETKIGDEIDSFPRGAPRLAKGAIPSIFPGSPEYLTRMNFPTKRIPLEPKSKINDSSIGANDENVSNLASFESKTEVNELNISTLKTEITRIPLEPQSKKNDSIIEINDENVSNLASFQRIVVDESNNFTFEEEITTKRIPLRSKSKNDSIIEIDDEPNFALFESRIVAIESIIPTFETKITEICSTLPPKWFFFYVADEDAAMFFNIGKGCSIEKRITVFNHMINNPHEYKIKVFVKNVEIKTNLRSVRNIDDIPSFISFWDSLKIQNM